MVSEMTLSTDEQSNNYAKTIHKILLELLQSTIYKPLIWTKSCSSPVILRVSAIVIQFLHRC